MLTGVRGHLTVVLTCISLMIRGAQHLFVYLLAIQMSSLEKCLCLVPLPFFLMRLVFIVELYEFIYFGC